jgi:hypothetical protein
LLLLSLLLLFASLQLIFHYFSGSLNLLSCSFHPFGFSFHYFNGSLNQFNCSFIPSITSYIPLFVHYIHSVVSYSP